MSETSKKAGREPGKDATQGQRLLARLTRAGFHAADVPVLQPADPFLELSGEDIRGRLLLTTDDDGAEFCLRPEFTIPAALAYLKGGVIGRRLDQVFMGPVFRHRPGDSGEFIQLSLESIGRTDREAADADILAETYLAVSEAVDGAALSLTIGDLGLFSNLLDAMALGSVTRRRLALALGEGRLAALLDPTRVSERRNETRGLARYSGVLDALKGADPAEAKAFVKDLLSMAGLVTTGGRSAEDIAGRFLERAREDAQTLGTEQAEILRRFIAVEGEPDAVAAQLRGLGQEAGIPLDAALDRFEMRTGFIEARGVPLGLIKASAGFSRSMDYYSGFVFDIRLATRQDRPLAAGGRYDRLFERLGHPVPGRDVPGIGAAIWVDRLTEAPSREESA